MSTAARSAISVTIAVWKALFLREAVSRLSAGRAAWLWLLLEPLSHVLFLMTMFGFIFHRAIAGVDGAMFITIGLFGFFMARNTAMQCTSAINANTALFAYRQVLPVDTVIVRAVLEGILMIFTILILLIGASLFGYVVKPHNPLAVISVFGGMWLSGAGLGLILSVVSELVPELGKLAKMLFTPLYFLSGVMFPAITVPQPYRDWLFLNPFIHGLEYLRAGFFPQFHMASEASLAYLYGFALITIFFGLALHLRFATRFSTQ